MAPTLLSAGTMKRGAFVALFLGTLSGACGGATEDSMNGPPPASSTSSSSGGSGGSSTPRETLDNPSLACLASVDGYGCEAPFHVSTSAEVIAASKALEYQPISVSQGTILHVGRDIVADTDIEVLASDLTPAPNCEGCHAPLFRTRAFPNADVVPGITCVDEGDEQPIVKSIPLCARVSIAKGTTFRLRPVVQDMHPSGPTFWPLVEFVAPCATSCGEGETLCPATHTCFKVGYDSCAFCEGLAPATCACRADACHAEADGKKCFFATSPDVERVGACRSGACVERR